MRVIELAVFMLCLALALPARADSSPIDPTFGVNGRVSTNFAGELSMLHANGAVLQPDGKLVVAGASPRPEGWDFTGFAVGRLNPDGTPDTQFNVTGQASLEFGVNPAANAVALQPDGKIVAVGAYGSGPVNQVAVVRFLANGAIDATFNQGEIVTTAVPDTDAVGSAVVIQADGKIVVAATGTGGSALIRYNANGSLDTTFGAAGTGIVSLNAFVGPAKIVDVGALALQPDGKIVTTGTSFLDATVHSIWIARFTSSGTLDSSFNGAGTVIVGFIGVEFARGLALQADGRIVVIGTLGPDIGLIRLNADGTLDASFGSNGKVRTLIGAFSSWDARDVAILGDGRIVVAITGFVYSSSSSASSSSLVMARYTANGVLDTTLAGTGIVSVPADPACPGGCSKFYSGNFIAAQSDGKVIVGGDLNVTGAALQTGTIVRFLDNGSFDSSFGSSGEVTTKGIGSVDTMYALAKRSDGTLIAAGSSDGNLAVAAYSADGDIDWSRVISGSGAVARAVLEQPDARIVIAGSNGIGPAGTTFTVIRLSSDGSLDPTFNGTGRADTLVGAVASLGRAAALQPDGKIVVAGSALNRSADDDFALARYNTDGTLDGTFGSGGQVLTPIGAGSDVALAVAVQADGRIVAAGSASDGATTRFAVVRYQGDGSLDSTFGSGGKSSFAVGVGSSSARAIAIQGDGKIVLAGTAASETIPLTMHVFAVVRLNGDGSLDSAFGSNGVVTTAMATALHPEAEASAVAVLEDGRILVGGSGSLLDFQGTFALVRYLPNGSLDTTFGTAGRLQVGAGTNMNVSTGTFTLQDANRAVLAGTVVATANFDLVRVFLDDVVAPDTSLVATPGATSGSTVMFSFTGTDVGGSDVASFECALDGAQFAGCTSPASYTGLPVASHTFQVRARDGAGNVDPTPASYAWDVVPQPQTIRFAELPSRVLTASPFEVSATGGDSGNPVVFTSLTLAACTTSGTNGATVTLVAAGTCTIAADQAGNASFLAASQLTRSFEVFATGFSLTVSRSGGGSGSVTSTPLGIDCGASCDWTFAPATAVTLVATPDGASAFVGWTGACTGSGPCNVTMDDAKSAEANFAHRTNARLINISTRGQVQTDFDVMIGGFVIGGSAPKTVVIRALGPTLADYGVPGALANPQLQLVRSSDGVVIASNDDWSNAANAATIAASGFAPSNPLESAIYITLQPGAYTAIVSGVDGGMGVGLVEVYEIDHPEIPLINISTRGKVATGDGIMIGGFVISGSDPRIVVVRGIGPSLAKYDISQPLSNPMLQLVSSASQTIIASNDDWGSADNAAAIQSSGFAPSDPKEAAIYITLQPGAYTAILSGVNGGTGTGLVEVYAVGP